MKAIFQKNPWIIHTSIWLGYLSLFIWLYSESKAHEPYLVKSVMIILIQVLIFYFNFHLLLPKYFEKKKYFHYSIFVLGSLIVSIILFYIFDKLSMDMEIKRALEENDYSRLPREFKGRGRYMHSGPWRGWRSTFLIRSLLFNGFFVVISLFISTIYRSLVVNQRKEKESINLRSKIMEAESNLLKSQINPHFLFNTLNNIYSMAQLKSDQTANAVHRLSEMLRYVIYDCSQSRVKLGQEIAYIGSYIELQLLKEEKMENIHYDLKEVNKNLKIAPMLLIPFIENSFKHSHIEDTINSWINIELFTSNGTLHLRVLNSIPLNSVKKDTTIGIGLDNVKKRLHLLYPGKHQLAIDRNGNKFSVELILNLDES